MLLNVLLVFFSAAHELFVAGGGYVSESFRNPNVPASFIRSCRNLNGKLGVCEKFSKCISAQTVYYTSNVTPTYCDYKQEDPIVCCTSTSDNPMPASHQVINFPGGINSANNDRDRAKPAPQLQNCRTNNDQFGVCRKYSQCPEAQNAFNTMKTPPIYCEYDRYDPVVCCPSTPVVTASPLKPTPSKNQVGQIREDRLSENRCRESYFPTNFGIAAVGGTPALPDEFPFMVAIGFKKMFGSGYDYRCGGTLISYDFALTAAHCASVGGASPDVARIGGNSLSDKGFDYPEVPIVEVIIHPEYNRKQIYNDIALLRLNVFGAVITTKSACLWPTDNIDFSEVTATGYGNTQFGGQSSEILIKVTLKIYSNEECSQYYPKGGYKTQNSVIGSQICAGDPSGKMDTCQGDSGGPLLIKRSIKNKTIPYILGITSFGTGCAFGPPSIYTRVSSFLDWIEPIVWPSGPIAPGPNQ